MQPAHGGPSFSLVRAAGASEGVKEEICPSLGASCQSQEMRLFLWHTRAAPFSKRQG